MVEFRCEVLKYLALRLKIGLVSPLHFIQLHHQHKTSDHLV